MYVPTFVEIPDCGLRGLIALTWNKRKKVRKKGNTITLLVKKVNVTLLL